MKNRTIKQTYELLKNRQITYRQIVEEKIALIKESLSSQNHTIEQCFFDDALMHAKKLDDDFSNSIKSIYSGVTCLLKSNVSYKNQVCNCGSRVLEQYYSPINATIVDLINKHNGIILGSVNMDELAMGGTGTSSCFGIPLNPNRPDCITGGSSSGSVSAIKLGLANFAIGTDTGDSIRHPCSLVGLVGFKPSYGLVSRFGVMPYSSDFDHVGVVTQCVEDAIIAIDMIKGKDQNDQTSLLQSDIEPFYNNLSSINNIKFYSFQNVNELIDDENKSIYNNFLNDVKNKYEISFIDFDNKLLEMLLPIYLSLSFLDAYTNWNNISGITFGSNNLQYQNYEDLLLKTRSQFGSEIKKRFLGFSRIYKDNEFDLIYQNSYKIRTIMVNKINTLLDDVDAIIVPSSSYLAPKISDLLAGKSFGNCADDILLLANFAGLPSISIPLTDPNSSKPFAINIFSKRFSDRKLLTIALEIEKIINEVKYYD